MKLGDTKARCSMDGEIIKKGMQKTESGLWTFAKNIMRMGPREVMKLIERQKFVIESFWETECFDRFGNLKWADDVISRNVCTDEGLNALLNIMFHGSTQITTWYIVPFEDDVTPASSDTYASPSFTECTAYSEANRPAFNEAAASGKSITNSANKASFSMNADKTLYGGALVGGGTDPSTKNDAAGGGTLYAASKFSSSKPVENGDTFKITCTLTAADV